MVSLETERRATWTRKLKRVARVPLETAAGAGSKFNCRKRKTAPA